MVSVEVMNVLLHVIYYLLAIYASGCLNGQNYKKRVSCQLLAHFFICFFFAFSKGEAHCIVLKRIIWVRARSV